MQAGTLATDPQTLRLALQQTIKHNNTKLLQRITNSGARLDDLVIGGHGALQYARFLKKSAVAAALELLMPG